MRIVVSFGVAVCLVQLTRVDLGCVGFTQHAGAAAPVLIAPGMLMQPINVLPCVCVCVCEVVIFTHETHTLVTGSPRRRVKADLHIVIVLCVIAPA